MLLASVLMNIITYNRNVSKVRVNNLLLYNFALMLTSRLDSRENEKSFSGAVNDMFAKDIFEKRYQKIQTNYASSNFVIQ